VDGYIGTHGATLAEVTARFVKVAGPVLNLVDLAGQWRWEL